MYMPGEELELTYTMEEGGETIPSPSPPESIPVSDGAFVTIIEAWMEQVRDEMENRSASVINQP